MSIPIGSLIRYEGVDFHEDGEHAFGIVIDQCTEAFSFR